MTFTAIKRTRKRCVLAPIAHLVPQPVPETFRSTVLKDCSTLPSGRSPSILNRITALDKKTGQLFRLKKQPSRAPLRLLLEDIPCRSDSREPRLAKAGFIAISYCWRASSWEPVSGFEACSCHGASMPVAHLILHAPDNWPAS